MGIIDQQFAPVNSHFNDDSKPSLVVDETGVWRRKFYWQSVPNSSCNTDPKPSLVVDETAFKVEKTINPNTTLVVDETAVKFEELTILTV